jgi:hypothetical protein
MPPYGRLVMEGQHCCQGSSYSVVELASVGFLPFEKQQRVFCTAVLLAATTFEEF